MNLQNRKTCRLRNIWTYGCWREGIVREFGMVMYTLLYSKWITNKNLLYSTFGGEWTHECWIPSLFTWNYHNIVNQLLLLLSRVSHVRLCDPIDSSPPGSPSLGFSRQEHWSGLPFPSPVNQLKPSKNKKFKFWKEKKIYIYIVRSGKKTLSHQCLICPRGHWLLLQTECPLLAPQWTVQSALTRYQAVLRST